MNTKLTGFLIFIPIFTTSTQSGIAQQVVEAMESASVNEYYYQPVQGHGTVNAGSNYGGQGYTWQMAELHDIEEGEAIGDDAEYDPDVAFPYLDLKLQNVLGHFQKEFEGGVWPDRIGSNFGGYGTFLPIRERSPSVLVQPKPTAVVQNHSLQNPSNERTVEHVRQEITCPVSAVTATKLTLMTNKNPSGSGALASDFANEHFSAANAVKDNDPGPAKIPLVVNDVKDNDQKAFKLCFKMSSDSVSRQKNTAIYSGLGLEHSSSPSLEDSPYKLEKFSTEAESTYDLSPFSIIQIMTSHHIPGSCLLSPLQDSLLNLLKLKEEPCNNYGTAWEGTMGIRKGLLIDSAACKEIRQQKARDDVTGGKSVNFREQVSGLHDGTAKEVTMDAEINSKVKDHVSNCPKFTSKSSIKEACLERLEMGITCDSEKGSIRGVCFMSEATKSQTKDRGFKSSLSREEHKEVAVTPDPGRQVKTGNRLMPKHGNEISKEHRPFQVMEEKKGIVCKDFASDVRKIGKETLRDQKKYGLQNDSAPLYKGKSGHKDETKGAPKDKVPGQGIIHEVSDKQKQHGKEVGAASKIKQKDMAVSKVELKEKVNSGLKQMHKELRKETHEKDPLQSETFDEGVKRNHESTEAAAKESCKDGMKDGRKERHDGTIGINVTHRKEAVKWTNSESFEREPSGLVERGKDMGVTKESSARHLKCASTSKAHALSSVVSQPLPVQTAVADACLAPVAPVVIQENWVCCDACGKWRLLPYGVEDKSLPTNWLCHMIYWLPGMNSCDVGEDEATQAHYALYGQQPGIQVETNQGQSLPAAASVSMPTLDIKQAEQSQEPKSLKLGTKSGTGKKGQVQKQTTNISDTAKLSGLISKKNELGCAKDRNNNMELHLHQAEVSVGLCHLPDEGNISGLKNLKHKGKEKANIKQISEGPDTEVADAHPLKLKRRREAESKEYMFAKKAKTKVFKGRDSEVGELGTNKITMMESKLKKHEDVKMVKSEGMKCAREDFFEENESGNRAGPLGYDKEAVKLSGGKTKRLKDSHKHFKNETNDCSPGAGGRTKCQNQRFVGTGNKGSFSGCGTGPDTEVANAHPLKVKRRREAESKEHMFSKKAKTEDSIGHDTGMGELAPLKIRMMESKLNKHEDVKIVKSEGMKCAREDFFEENESGDRAGPSGYDHVPVQLSGGKTKRRKDPLNHIKNETSDCSMGAGGRMKCQQQPFVGTGPDTEVAGAHSLKLKRRRGPESKELILAKKSKTKDSIGHDTEMGDLATLKIRTMESELQKHNDVKMVRSEDMTSARVDSFESKESDDRVGPSRKDNESVKLSGGKTTRLKDPPNHLKSETSNCSLAADERLKYRKQACVETDNKGTHSACDTSRSDKKDYTTKKRKLKEWKESQMCQQGVSLKEESETECRKETVSKVERRESNDVKDGKRHRVNKILSSNQALSLDESQVKSSGGFDEKHEVGQSRVHGVNRGVSVGTDSLKRDSGHRSLFASETSSSSKVSSHPKIVSTLQDVRGSPVESVSSSPVRSFKAGKLQLARNNSMGMDDLMCFRKPSLRRCSDGEGDALNDPSGLRTSIVGNMVRAAGDIVLRDGKQFSDDKIKDKNVHKKQGMGSSDAGNFVSGHNNLRFANDVKCSNEMRAPDGRQGEYGEHNIMGTGHERREGREKCLSSHNLERVKSYHDKAADKQHGYTGDGNDKGNANERNIWGERMLSGRHEAYSACSKDFYDDKLTCKEENELKNCMVSNSHKELKTSGTSIKGNQLQQKMGQSKEILNFGSYDSCAKQHMDSISSEGKALVSNCKDGKPSSRQSLQQDPFVDEKASDKCLPQRNVLDEIALVKAKSKVPSHSANTSKVQGNGTAVEVLLKNVSQLQGSAYDASSGEFSRVPRDSVAVANGTQSCDVGPPVSNDLVGRDAKGTVASPTKKEPLQVRGNAALKEAKDLKHKAEKLKNIGGDELESTSLYFRASLKFLHTASMLEPFNADDLKHGESQSITAYTETARLCEFCAGAYERNNEMAAAALAYKCKGVAHMRVVVAKNALINIDRHELQAAARVILPGESPSSSASDIDNHVLMDRNISMDQAKGAESLQVPGSDVSVAQQRPHLVRLLQYTKDVNAAVEAFAKAESAFVAARDSHYGPEEISAIKRAIDFNFCDIDGLLNLVLLAMEAFDH